MWPHMTPSQPRSRASWAMCSSKLEMWLTASFTRAYRLTERPVLLAAPGTPGVVNPVKPQQRAVAPVAEVRRPDEIPGHAVEHVAVQDEIPTAHALVDVVLDHAQVFELQRQEIPQDI